VSVILIDKINVKCGNDDDDNDDVPISSEMPITQQPT
jgi:hypothetical protein